MNGHIEVELAEQRREALDRIAARCAEALRVVERQARNGRKELAEDRHIPTADLRACDRAADC